VTHQNFIGRCGTGLAIALSLMALPLVPVYATPVIDGERDAEYTKIATSPKDNLNTAGVDVNSAPFNDETNPVAKVLDVTDMWAANTASDLYVFIEMPYLDLNIISGEWAIAFHLGGANDALQRLGVVGDPYGAPIYYEHNPGVNAVLKSNMRGFKHSEGNNVGFDGNQGYAFLNSINHGQNDWTWDTGNFLGNTWTDDIPNHLIRGVGNSGGEIVYKGFKGIEVKIPLALFAANPGNTPVTAPKIGDVINMQFYNNVRYYSATNTATEKYPRGPTDAVPFQASVYSDPIIGYISQMAAYTLKAPTALEVSGARLVSSTDTTHLLVNFSAPLGDGAGTASNYSVVDTATGAAVPVTSAEVDFTDDTRVILGLNVPFNTTLRVTVTGVKNSSGTLITEGKNTATVKIGTGVRFNLYDPYGLIARIGNDPGTGQPYTITVPGDHQGWNNFPTAANAVILSPVSGESGHWQSPIVVINPGLNGYKYSQPNLPNWDNWNALTPYDRRAVIPPSSTVVDIIDNAAGTYEAITSSGPTVDITFTLVDLENKAAGRDVHLTGEMWAWTGDAGIAPKMEPVPGKPNTYSVTVTTPANFGQDITHKYKYLAVNTETFETDWNVLNPNGEWGGDHHIITKGSGTPLKQNVEDIVGPRSQRIARIAAGFNQAPGLAGYWRELDMDVSGAITLLDLLRAVRQ